MDEQEKIQLLTESVQSPASAAVDGRSVTSRPLSDLIAALRYLANVEAAKQDCLGIRFRKLTKPATGD